MNPYLTLARRTCVLAAILGATVAAQAQITVSTTNSEDALLDYSSVDRPLSFAPGDIAFPGHSVLDVNISVTFAKADGERFDRPFPFASWPFFDEIELTLTRGATSVSLIAEYSFNAGFPGTLFDGTILFDDEAADIVNVNPWVVQAGTFKPVELLSAFDGQLFTPGDWALTITDTAGGDALRFYEATLFVTYAGTSPDTQQIGAVPEPSTYGLIGAALLGGLVIRRRLRAVNAVK